jgi:hypothetical protein
MPVNNRLHTTDTLAREKNSVGAYESVYPIMLLLALADDRTDLQTG